MSQLYERPPTQQIVLVSLYINLIQWSSWRWRPFASASTSLKVTKTHRKRIKNASKTHRSRDNAAPILINFGLALLDLPLHNLLQKRVSYCHRDKKNELADSSSRTKRADSLKTLQVHMFAVPAKNFRRNGKVPTRSHFSCPRARYFAFHVNLSFSVRPKAGS
jgi:hypothetical protein